MGAIDWNIRLQTDRVLMRPIQADDIAGFREICFDPDIWRFFAGEIANEEDLARFVQTALDDWQGRTRLPFTVIDRSSGRIAGSTSFGNISMRDARLEIGWTWLSSAHRGAGVNRHCKFLLLRYAFEDLALERVEFKTDVLNEGARKALKKIGAVEEGVLRSHTLMPRGRRRDTIYYSVLKREWPEVKARVFGDLLGR